MKASEMSNIEQAVQQLQDNMLVIAEMERRQTEMLRDHADMLHQHNLVLAESLQFQQRTERNLASITDKLNRHTERAEESEQRSEEFRQHTEESERRSEQLWRRIEQNLAEITDKLNGLIGYVDGLPKTPKQPN